MNKFTDRITMLRIAVGASMLLAMGAASVAQLGDGGVWSLSASAPVIIGSYEDPFRYDGTDVRPMEGGGRVDVDSLKDEGTVRIEVNTTEGSGPIRVSAETSLSGSILLLMQEFTGSEPFQAGGVAEALRLHGDTGRMSTAMPELVAHLAGWGRLDIYVDGELRYEDLAAHFMLTESVRRGPEGGFAVLRASDGTIYDPSLEDKTGFVYSQELELHIWASSSSESIGVSPGEELFLHLNLAVDEAPLAGQALGVESPEAPPSPEDPDEPEDGGGSKGNNGIGNGVDPQPPGNPPVNDGETDGHPGKGRSRD